MNRIYLVRHGENFANLTAQFSYKLVDYPLTPKGVLQARQTALFFKDKDIHAIYTSPLLRAVQTAQIIAAEIGLPVTIDEDFREVNVGALEQGPSTAEKWEFHNQIIFAWLDGHPEMRFPEGEDYFGLLGRMRAGLQRITQDRDGHNLVVVGHGGIFTFTLPGLCPGTDRNQLLTTYNQNCSISEIEVDQQDGQLGCQLVSWASCSHLSGEASAFSNGYPDPKV